VSERSTTRIRVAGERPYDVVVGRRLAAEIGSGLASVGRAAVIHPASRPELGVHVAAVVSAAGVEPLLLPVPDAEAAKTADVAAQCWSQLGRSGFTRSDAVVGVGGGATTDLAGFVAATWLRGVRLVTVPTSLLAMVDAAVGGKTGINTVEGKNLVGAFHEPALVVCDLDTLASLPPVDVAAGMAEVVKVGLTSDPRILEIVEEHPAAALDVTSDQLREVVERAIAVKASVVAADLRESQPGGLGREVLNYGHTFGHAVEQVEGYRWRHGEAVSVGLVFVAALARLAGRLPDSDAARHAELLSSLGLPTTYAAGRLPELVAAMKVDKKSRGDVLRFVVLDGIGGPGLLEGPDPELVAAAYAELSRETP
jgi:3-dehydroquinate synthase